MAATSDLITLLEREAAAEREKVLAEARAQAEALRAQARSEAEALIADARARADAEAQAALVRARSAAQLRAQSMVLRAKEEEIARVFARARAELDAFAQDRERYPAALEAFIEECVRDLAGRAVISVNPADLPVAERLVRSRGWDATVQADPAIRGGVRVATPDGRFAVTNTLESRLERARPALAAEVARRLWE